MGAYGAVARAAAARFASVCCRVTKAIAGIVRRQRDEEQLRKDVFRHAACGARKGESDPDDLKLVAGGLLDCEFMAQFLFCGTRTRAGACHWQHSSGSGRHQRNNLCRAEQADRCARDML